MRPSEVRVKKARGECCAADNHNSCWDLDGPPYLHQGGSVSLCLFICCLLVWFMVIHPLAFKIFQYGPNHSHSWSHVARVAKNNEDFIFGYIINIYFLIPLPVPSILSLLYQTTIKSTLSFVSLCLCIHLYPHPLSLHLCSVGCRPSCPQRCCSVTRLMVDPPSKATKPLCHWLSTRAFTLIGWLAGVL